MKQIIYYSATWCAPCKTLLPKVRKFCDAQGIALQVVMVDKTPDRVPQDIMGVPSVDLFDNDSYLGRLTKEQTTVKNIQTFLGV